MIVKKTYIYGKIENNGKIITLGGENYMNEVLNAIITRRSCKSFKPDMISQQDIDQVIEAGLYAASGLNTQSPIIIAVTDKETRVFLGAKTTRTTGAP